MEGEQKRVGTVEAGGVLLRKPTPARPQPTLPLRPSAESLYKEIDSPMSMVPGFLGDQDSDLDARSFSHLLAGVMASSPASDSVEEKPVMDSGMNLGSRSIGAGSPVRGSFAERLAARGAANKAVGFGFGMGAAPRPSPTARFKDRPPSRIPIPRAAAYLTIPPGLSPTTLLDSPVLLSTSQAEPSPTTGTFPVPPFFASGGPRAPLMPEPSEDRSSDQGGSPGFVFKPFVKTVSRNTLSPLAGVPSFGLSQQQAQVYNHMQQAHAQQHVPSSSAPSASARLPSTSTTGPSGIPLNATPLERSHPQPQSQQPESGVELEQTSQGSEQEQQIPHLVNMPAIPERPSEDGYNWRKYGQKQVKGSEYPRSYYKCTHASCPMKKKVERSHDGQVTEIVYKGDHNHPKPQPTRRLALSGAHLISDNSGGPNVGGYLSMVKNERGIGAAEGDSMDSSRAGQIQPTLSFSLGATGTPDPSSPSTSDDEGEEGSKLSTEDGDDDEPESKRRKKDKKVKETVPASRTIREPRVVVQTTSDVDILDDGYRWRKYGQKVVKGNPHPRSYYKCTNVGCLVRKHVERASNDAKAVITTYEGKHNHDVPAARNSGHDSAAQNGSTAFPSNPATTGATSLQDQGARFSNRTSVYGHLLEDGSKGEKAASDVDLGIGMSMGARIMGAREMGLPVSTSIAISLSASMGHSNFNEGRPGQGRESFGQGPNLGARLKQEQPEATSQMLLMSNMAPRLVSGPP